MLCRPRQAIFFPGEVFADKPVLADKTEDERFNAQTAQSHFAVGNCKADLYHVANFDFSFDAAINDLDVKGRGSDFARFNLRALHFLKNALTLPSRTRIIRRSSFCSDQVLTLRSSIPRFRSRKSCCRATGAGLSRRNSFPLPTSACRR